LVGAEPVAGLVEDVALGLAAEAVGQEALGVAGLPNPSVGANGMTTASLVEPLSDCYDSPCPLAAGGSVARADVSARATASRTYARSAPWCHTFDMPDMAAKGGD
ncbi:hypothetical protein, partial [Streptomyces sp. NPDC002346]